MFTRISTALLPVLSLVTVGACMDDASAPQSDSSAVIDDVGLNPVGVAHRDNGNEIRFYEPSPGQLLTVELGSGMTLPDADSAVAQFRAAEPDAIVPASLTAAQLRRDAAAAIAGPADATARRAGLSTATSDRKTAAIVKPATSDPCDPNNFVANECTDGDQEWCKISWSNGFYAYNSSVDWTHNAVCPLSGTLTMRLLVDSAVKGSFTFSSGIGRYSWYGSNFSMRQEVINATGSTFRVGGAAGG